MGVKKGLTDPMFACVNMTHDHGGKLIRFVGGYWSWEGVARHSHNGNPVEYCGTSTVEALVKRGYLEYSEWRDGRTQRFPITVKIKEAA